MAANDNNETDPVATAGIEKLLNLIGCIDDAERDKDGLTKDICNIYLEAKVCGFDTESLREIIR